MKREGSKGAKEVNGKGNRRGNEGEIENSGGYRDKARQLEHKSPRLTINFKHQTLRQSGILGGCAAATLVLVGGELIDLRLFKGVRRDSAAVVGGHGALGPRLASAYSTVQVTGEEAAEIFLVKGYLPWASPTYFDGTLAPAIAGGMGSSRGEARREVIARDAGYRTQRTSLG
jgi:hypothetical protein